MSSTKRDVPDDSAQSAASVPSPKRSRRLRGEQPDPAPESSLSREVSSLLPRESSVELHVCATSFDEFRCEICATGILLERMRDMGIDDVLGVLWSGVVRPRHEIKRFLRKCLAVAIANGHSKYNDEMTVMLKRIAQAKMLKHEFVCETGTSLAEGMPQDNNSLVACDTEVAATVAETAARNEKQ